MLGLTFMKLIVADIGGTNARFAVSEKGNPSLRHITHCDARILKGLRMHLKDFWPVCPVTSKVAIIY